MNPDSPFQSPHDFLRNRDRGIYKNSKPGPGSEVTPEIQGYSTYKGFQNPDNHTLIIESV
jgi:hypothetical protein